MRCPPDHLARPQPPVVPTLAALRQVQSQIAALATPVDARVDVPLPRLAGRVLAEDVPAGPDAGPPLVPRGTRLEARHLPLLAGSGRTTLSALARPRVGVMALACEPAPAVHPRTGALASAAWVAATVERLGAQAFEAACRDPDPRRFMERLEMFVGECELVVVLGYLNPALCEAVREAQRRRGQPALVDALRPRPFGALQVMQVGATLVVALSADLDSAVAAFTTLLTPLLRRLQGRPDLQPEVRVAELDDPRRPDEAHWRLLPARVAPGAADARLRLATCQGADAAIALAGADGLAWQPAELANLKPPLLAYFPFDTWTR